MFLHERSHTKLTPLFRHTGQPWTTKRYYLTVGLTRMGIADIGKKNTEIQDGYIKMFHKNETSLCTNIRSCLPLTSGFTAGRTAIAKCLLMAESMTTKNPCQVTSHTNVMMYVCAVSYVAFTS